MRLLSTRNVAFVILFTQIIKLTAHFPDHPIKIIHLDNTSEFTFKVFDDYYTLMEIDVEHLVSHVHTHGLAGSLIKILQVIART